MPVPPVPTMQGGGKPNSSLRGLVASSSTLVLMSKTSSITWYQCGISSCLWRRLIVSERGKTAAYRANVTSTADEDEDFCESSEGGEGAYGCALGSLERDAAEEEGYNAGHTETI